MHRHDPPGLQDPEQLAGDKVEVFKELLITLAIAKIPIGIAVCIQR